MTAIQVQSLSSGVEWLAGTDGALSVGAGRLVLVVGRGTNFPVNVFADQELTTPLTQPLSTSATGAVPGYIRSGQSVDFVDVTSGLRAQSEALAAADVIGSDGKVGGAGTVGLPAYLTEVLPSGGDDTAALNAAAAAGNLKMGAGTFLIDGTVTFPVQFSQLGSGTGQTILQLGPSGQVLVADPDNAGTVPLGSAQLCGCQTGEFTVFGNSVNNVTGGGMRIVDGNGRLYPNLSVQFCAGVCLGIENTQNNVFINLLAQFSEDVPVQFDNGTGGNRFFGGEIGVGSKVGSVRFQQSTSPSTGGYPSFLGPSDNTFSGLILEYSGDTTIAADLADGEATGGFTGRAAAQVWHGAGTSNKFIGCSINMQGQVETAAVVKVVNDSNAITAVGSYTEGSNIITLAEAPASGAITPLMTVGCPGFPSGTGIESASGTTVTLFANATESGTNVSIGFGALSTGLMMHDQFLLGDGGVCTMIQTNGGEATVYLTGRTVLQAGGGIGFETYVGDTIDIAGPLEQLNVGTLVKQNPADTAAGWNADNALQHVSYGTQNNLTQGDGPAFSSTVAGQTYPNLIGQAGSIYFSNGTIAPGVEASIGFGTDPQDSASVTEIPISLLTGTLRVRGDAGLTVWSQFIGFLDSAGAPSTSDQPVGTWLLDTNGRTWVVTASGSPDTWASNVAPTIASGSVTLVAGSATIANTKVTASTIVRTNRQASGGTPGFLSVTATAGTGLTIKSSSSKDTSTVFYEIVSY